MEEPRIKVRVSCNGHSEVIEVGEIDLAQPVSKLTVKNKAKHAYVTKHLLSHTNGLTAMILPGEIERIQRLQAEHGLLAVA
jgi:metal-responsive CopG/Arc/MetJ family transcriptional regulator